MNQILDLMVAHHALLEALFASFKDEAKDKSSKASASLSELTWEMQKHFFSEESAIFNYPQLRTMGVSVVVNQLKKEHEKMLSDLQNFSENLPNIGDEEIESFHNLLESHRKIEELNLYPRLDKDLQDSQKRQIVARINEIPMKG